MSVRESKRVVHHERAVFIDEQKEYIYSNLREELVAAQVSSQFDSMQLFLPGPVQTRILKKYDVAVELQDSTSDMPETELQMLAQFVLESAKQIFLILVYSRLTSKMRLFFQYGFNDEKLPVEYNIGTGEITTEGDLGSEQVKVFSSWHPTQIREFCDTQWRFTAPTFSRLASSYRIQYDLRLPRQTILPFNVEGNPKGTPFSKVWKIWVHPGHRENLFVPYDGCMALKESANNIEGVREQINNSNKVNAELEALEATSRDAIQKTRSTRAIGYAKHLTGLRAAFQRGNVSYMVFPWADGGNLYQYWREADPETATAADLHLWIQGQIGGLIGALRLLHYDLNCRHGDLKPDNILVFYGGIKGFGRLAMADFGLTRFHELATQYREEATKSMSGAQRYEPPEANKAHPNRENPWSRRYDIWSMGCIFLEFIIWLCRGKRRLEDFNADLGDRRVEKFWKFDNSASQKEFILHPVVVDEIKEIKTLLNKKQEKQKEELHAYLLYLLDKVEARMLVIETSNEEEDKERAYRATSDALFQDFESDGMIGHSFPNTTVPSITDFLRRHGL